MTIREATADDIPRMVEMGMRFNELSEYRERIKAKADAITATLGTLIDSPSALVLLAERDGRAVGMIGAIATLHIYSGEPVMSELFWWVEPEYRGIGLRLLHAAEDWARANNLTQSVMISPSPEVSALYRRLGYSPLEEQFVKTL
ncbi:MAG: GNAT family N-acetyltransferase [Sulfuritalea sp.]|nr:GNAT family N-acetyltransferase [Sulfuritalea sp.]